MKILITGAGGQLGEELVNLFEGDHDLRSLAHAELDITDQSRVEEAVGDFQPDALVNAAAYTDVDGAETDPEGAFSVNATGAKYLVEAAGGVDAHLVHISTDYVFGGDKKQPYTTEDCPDPINTYGISKLAGDHFVLNYPRGTVIRTSGVYGGEPGKHDNFVNTVLELAETHAELTMVDDQVMSPTWTRPVAETVEEVLSEEITGLQHFTAGGSCTWYEFTKFLLDKLEIDIPVKPITTEELNLQAERPGYSVLNNSLESKSWREMLRQYCTLYFNL